MAPVPTIRTGSGTDGAWLVTGGAGYIGGHVTHALRAAGYRVVVFDDLSTGRRRRVPDGAPLVRGSLHDPGVLEATFREHRITGVVHLAAKKAAGESVARPLYYYRENVGGLGRLLSAMVDAGVRRLVFSSSAAVYGTAEAGVVDERTPTMPLSPYGETKLIGEWLVRDVARAAGLNWVIFRYFNVAGTSRVELADDGASNLVPLALQALSAGRRPLVFGDDYPTRDGTCVRDYIHVGDVADAHLVGVRRLEQGPCNELYNVGRGTGVSVKEVMSVARTVTGVDLDFEVVPRRPGDPAHVEASTQKIAADLGWRARLDIEAMIRSAWQARTY